MYRVITAAKSAPLYHGTTTWDAISIIESNELRAHTCSYVEGETYGVSLTRNPASAEVFGEVSLILDQEGICQNYPMKPLTRYGELGRDIAEERVPRTIKNIRRYIRGLIWNRPEKMKRLRRVLTENSEDLEILDRKYLRPGGPINIAWAMNRLIELAETYGFSLDDNFLKAKQLIQEFS